jgi:hypothetical protein
MPEAKVSWQNSIGFSTKSKKRIRVSSGYARGSQSSMVRGLISPSVLKELEKKMGHISHDFPNQ